jgi:hypothetical protein
LVAEQHVTIPASLPTAVAEVPAQDIERETDLSSSCWLSYSLRVVWVVGALTIAVVIGLLILAVILAVPVVVIWVIISAIRSTTKRQR